MKPEPVLRRKPEARAETVEYLVGMVLQGEVRVPTFQRGLKWTAKDVIDLLDSICRGYPIGSLLFWKRPADAKRLHVGPLLVEAPEMSSASWVIDGQQRITAIAASLARDEPIPKKPIDPYVVYFDPEEERFQSPPARGEIPTTWIPATLLLDASRLSEWVVDWPHFRDVRLRQALFEAGKRLREYSVPLYVVDTDNESLLKEIFYRVNSAGQRLTWNEIHDALFGKTGRAPSTLESLGDRLSELGMGRVEEDTLLQCLLSVRGLDVTQNLAEHRRRDPSVLKNAVRDALPPLRHALSFLRESAEIPHLRLLPRVLPLIVLARFFAVHPEPSARSRELLARWVWRLFLTVGTFDERTMLRAGVRAIQAADQENSVQALLRLAPRRSETAFVIPASFDPRSAANRVILTSLAMLGPRSLITGERIDIAALLEKAQAHAFQALVEPMRGASDAAKTSANRAIHPKDASLQRSLLERVKNASAHDDVLVSHAIGVEAARALVRGDTAAFLHARTGDITKLVNDTGERLAAWSRNDRLSIHRLLSDVRAPS